VRDVYTSVLKEAAEHIFLSATPLMDVDTKENQMQTACVRPSQEATAAELRERAQVEGKGGRERFTTSASPSMIVTPFSLSLARAFASWCGD